MGRLLRGPSILSGLLAITYVVGRLAPVPSVIARRRLRRRGNRLDGEIATAPSGGPRNDMVEWCAAPRVLHDQHRIAEGVEAVTLRLGRLVGGQDKVSTGEGGDQQQTGRARQG